MAAAQVSVGMLGVIATITLQTISAYNLREKLWRDDFEACMDQHDELAARHRHFSFFWCPVPASRHLYCLPDVASVSPTKREYDVCEMKMMDVTDEAPFAMRRPSSASPIVRKSIRSNMSPISTNSNMQFPSKTARRRCARSAISC